MNSEIVDNGYMLIPGRYVGTEVIEEDVVPFKDKMSELTATLYEQFSDSERLKATIKKNLEALGYGE